MLIDPNIVKITKTGKDSSKDSSCVAFPFVPQRWLPALHIQGSVSPLPIPAALRKMGARDSLRVLQLGKGSCWSIQEAETPRRGLLGQRDFQEKESGVGHSSKCYLPHCRGHALLDPPPPPSAKLSCPRCFSHQQWWLPVFCKAF